MVVLALVVFGVWASAQISAPYPLVRVEPVLVPQPVQPGGAIEVLVRVDILPGWHINAHAPAQAFLIPTRIELVLPPGFQVEERWPAPQTRKLGISPAPLELYEGLIEVVLRIRVGAEVPPSAYLVKGKLHYQACNDEVCVPPASVEFEFPLEVAPGEPAPGATAPTSPGARALWAPSFLWALGTAFLVGLGLNLTPCVYPMVPVTVAFFARTGGQRTSRTLALALSYLGGIALTYSVLGSLAALGGGMLGMALQHPAVLAFLAAVMVALSLSFFGVYTLRAPAALLRRLPRLQNTGVLGALLMGAVVGLVAAPCVGPATVAFITYVASLGDPLRGFLLFLALSLGLGLPYVGLALLSGKLRALPKPGPWTVWVEHVFGFFLLGMALYFLSPLLPEAGLRGAAAALAMGGGLVLLISGLRRHSKGLALVSVVVAGLGLALGLWQLRPAAPGSELPWTPYTPTVLAQARERGDPVVLYFSADWCLPCKELSATTFRDQRVQAALAKVSLVKVDLTDETPEERGVRERFRVVGVPTVIFLGPQGEERGRLLGYVNAQDFLAALRQAYGEPG